MILLVTLGILIILSYIGYVFSKDNYYENIFVICMMLFSIFFGVYAQQEKDKQTPQAIEVYQGKTTLEITYRDSIPIDSVVIYK